MIMTPRTSKLFTLTLALSALYGISLTGDYIRLEKKYTRVLTNASQLDLVEMLYKIKASKDQKLNNNNLEETKMKFTSKKNRRPSTLSLTSKILIGASAVLTTATAASAYNDYKNNDTDDLIADGFEEVRETAESAIDTAADLVEI